MTDVMPRGHDGDGRDDPPPPGGRLLGQHEEDVQEPRRPTGKRGTAKNLQLDPIWEENGKKPLTLHFDMYTSTPVGKNYDLFIREASNVIMRDIPLDRGSWKNVSPAEKNALYEHLMTYFDIQEILEDPSLKKLKGGLEFVIGSRYRGRKATAKRHFINIGGLENVERARANPPEGMSGPNWNKSIDFFTTQKHIRRSAKNKVNRGKQTIKNRGGTSSYSSACHKKNLTRLQVFHDAHVNKEGKFDDPVAEEQYNALQREIDLQTQLSASSSNPTPVDEPRAFEKVLGERRGHIKGIGHKPSGEGTSTSGHSHISKPPKRDKFDKMLRNPRFLAAMKEVMQAFSTDDDDDEENDASEDEDDNGAE